MLRSIDESREEFNRVMQPYNQIIILNSGRKVDLSPWGIGTPQENLFYMPPYWVGPDAYSNCIRKSRGDQSGLREESIPEIKNVHENYLICDDYFSEGCTIELAAIRLLEAGINPERIWIFLNEANLHWKDKPRLDTLVALHKYLRTVQRLNRNLVTSLGVERPSFEDYLI
jgi:hypothetical protein